jgi:aminoglycoside phosphotransferase (APT) family kinase protein
MRVEADVMRACRRAGLRVPEVLVDDDGAMLGTAGLVMARVPGETVARRILRDDRFATARGALVGDLGRFLAGLHALDPAEVPGVASADSLDRYWESYALFEDTSPVFERAAAWLRDKRPPTTATTVVHGDLRMGNLIVDERGLAAAIDWELVHLGDPLEDLAWLSVKAWRFGAAPEVGGVGSLDDLVAAYEGAGGRRVDRGALHWWLVQRTLQWGIICMGQAWAHLSGAFRSHELAAIGRRVAEQEWDLIELLAPETCAAVGTEPALEPRPDIPGRFGRPTAREMVEAVQEFLTDDVMPSTSGRLSYHARVAANMLAIVGRELAAPPVDPPGDDWLSLARVTRARLLVANPRHLDGVDTSTPAIHPQP